MSDALLEVRDLRAYIDTRRGVVKAVDGATFSVRRGETLGIVGESGSGKSMTCLSILRLVPEPGGRIAGGRIVFDGEDLLAKSPDEMRRLLGAIVRGQARGDLDAVGTALRGAGVRIDEGTDLNGLLTLMSLVTGHPPTGFVGDPKGAMAVSLGRLPVELILVGRALGLLHGITRQLDPTLDVLEVVASHAARAAAS